MYKVYMCVCVYICMHCVYIQVGVYMYTLGVFYLDLWAMFEKNQFL